MGKECLLLKLNRIVLVAMAIAILSTAVSAQNTRPEPRPLPVMGIITAIDAAQKLVTLNGPTGDPARQARRPIVFACNDDTKIIKDGQEAGFDALALQDECEALCKGTENGLLAVRVAARTPRPRLAWVNGVIAAVDLTASTFDLRMPPRPDDPNPIVRKFSVDGETRIIKNGQSATLGNLKPGDLAAVGFVPSPELEAVVGPIRASVVEARTPPVEIAHIIGTLVEVTDQGQIVVARPGTDNVRFQLTPDTTIVKLHEVGPQALLPGDIVDVAFNRVLDVAVPPAIAVAVQPFPFGGIIAAVNLENQTVAIQQTPTSPARLFKVVRETMIKKNGAPAPLEALRPRDIAEVRFFHFREIDVAGAIVAQAPRPNPR